MSLLRPKIRFRPLRKAVAFAAIGFGLGLSPVAPGTVGSLLGCLIVWGFTAAALPQRTEEERASSARAVREAGRDVADCASALTDFYRRAVRRAKGTDA